jgi:hypothetical protein
LSPGTPDNVATSLRQTVTKINTESTAQPLPPVEVRSSTAPVKNISDYAFLSLARRQAIHPAQLAESIRGLERWKATLEQAGLIVRWNGCHNYRDQSREMQFTLPEADKLTEQELTLAGRDIRSKLTAKGVKTIPGEAHWNNRITLTAIDEDKAKALALTPIIVKVRTSEIHVTIRVVRTITPIHPLEVFVQTSNTGLTCDVMAEFMAETLGKAYRDDPTTFDPMEPLKDSKVISVRHDRLTETVGIVMADVEGSYTLMRDLSNGGIAAALASSTLIPQATGSKPTLTPMWAHSINEPRKYIPRSQPAQLQDARTEANGHFAQLLGRVSALERRLDEHHMELTTRMAGIEANMANMQKAIDGCVTAIQDVQNDLSLTRFNVSHLNSITLLEHSIREDTRTLDRLEEELQGVESSHKATNMERHINKLRARLEKDEEELADKRNAILGVIRQSTQQIIAPPPRQGQVNTVMSADDSMEDVRPTGVSAPPDPSRTPTASHLQLPSPGPTPLKRTHAQMEGTEQTVSIADLVPAGTEPLTTGPAEDHIADTPPTQIITQDPEHPIQHFDMSIVFSAYNFIPAYPKITPSNTPFYMMLASTSASLFPVLCLILYSTFPFISRLLKPPLPTPATILLWLGLSRTHRYTRTHSNHPRYGPALPNVKFKALRNRYVTYATMAFLLLPRVAAAPTINDFSIYSLNMAGSANAMKIHTIRNAITITRPHIYVLSETQSSTRVMHQFDTNSYEHVESTGVQKSGNKGWKWGVLMGIRRQGIQVRQVIPTAHLQGRAVAADIVIPGSDGRGINLRVIGLYAPYDPGEARHFWDAITLLCTDAPDAWVITGDLNLTMSSSERSSQDPPTPLAGFYRSLLEQSAGIDLWCNQDEREVNESWTCRARNGNGARSIIDRTAVSRRGIVEATIRILDKGSDFIPCTDHRPIWTRLVPCRTDGTKIAQSTAPLCPPPPRYRYPNKLQRERFTRFRDACDKRISESKISPVVDVESFLRRYDLMTEIMLSSAKESFERASSRLTTPTLRELSSPAIKQIIAEKRCIGGSLMYLRGYSMSQTTAAYYEKAQLQFLEGTTLPGDVNQHDAFKVFLTTRRRILNRELYQAQSNEAKRRARAGDEGRMKACLYGGSAKWVMGSTAEFIGAPIALEHSDGSLVSSPADVKAVTREYFGALYQRTASPQAAKPWLTTNSVVETRQRVTATPFQWPRSASLEEFRMMLRRGNARPSPGPDGWEKWMVKSLSDEALELIVELHNWLTLNANFPDKLRAMYLTTIHKKGVRTNLVNWRGVMFSNFLFNSPLTWLTTCLTPYASQVGLIPETQVATQLGVQSRDITSYLAQVKTWAQRSGTKVYALKRDQKKGFDYLAPQGFYDAVEAYGLPSSIIDLDRAAQSSVTCYIRTAYGLTDPIIIDGVTKQGGPLSPLKSTMTTSLGHRFLADLLKNDPGALFVQTQNAAKGKFHLPADLISHPIAMVEATDDSITFAKSLPTLKNAVLAMERFQYTYGWWTSWDKSEAYILNAEEGDPEQLEFNTIDPDNPDDTAISAIRQVKARKNGIEFLRAEINDGPKRATQLAECIENFILPRFSLHTPITVVRKLISQCLFPRIRALLSLQPILPEQAAELDKLVAKKVHRAMGFLYAPNPSLLSLPIHLRGFGFPSVQDTNSAMAFNGLLRDLNHHIPAYKAMASITMADWTCQKSGCSHPLSDSKAHNFTKQSRYIPLTWVIAHKAMQLRLSPLSILPTDQSFILEGNIGLEHMLNQLQSQSDNTQDWEKPTATVFNVLRRRGIEKLQDVANWNDLGALDMLPRNFTTVRRASERQMLQRNLSVIQQALRKVKLFNVVQGEVSLAIPTDTRQRMAEDAIVAMSSPLPDGLDHKMGTWATDGSMAPATARLHEPRVVTSAVIGDRVAVFRHVDRTTSILHGEVFALVAARVLQARNNANSGGHIYSDHLNSVRLITDTQINEMDKKLRSMNGRALYRWYLSIGQQGTKLNYVAGHTNELSLPSVLNYYADYYASRSIANHMHLPTAPVPTFTMDAYMPWNHVYGYIEGNTIEFMRHHLALERQADLRYKYGRRIGSLIYDTNPPPEHPYIRSFNSFSAAVQLYARSGQLDTPWVNFRRGIGGTGECDFGCNVPGTLHHIFAECYRFASWREESKNSILLKLKAHREKFAKETQDEEWDKLRNTAEYLFTDNEVWPGGLTYYYLGHIPKVDELIPPGILTSAKRNQLSCNVARDWHLASIWLAGRIWGEVGRMRRARWV